MIKMWKHPNYYKNLRKLYRSRNRDQAISLQASTEDARRTPGTGLRVTSHKLPGPRPISNSNKGLIHKRSSSQAGGRVGPKGSSLQAGAQASSGARINKR